MDKIKDEEFVGLEVTYDAIHKKTLLGAKNSFGVSEEPDEEVYIYEVKAVSIFDIDIDLNKLPLIGIYKEEDEMMIDVSDKVEALIKEKLG